MDVSFTHSGHFNVLSLRPPVSRAAPQPTGGFVGHDRDRACRDFRPVRIVFYAEATAGSAPHRLRRDPAHLLLENNIRGTVGHKRSSGSIGWSRLAKHDIALDQVCAMSWRLSGR